MKQSDKVKLGISRNWKFPGQMRLLNYLKPSKTTSSALMNGIIWLEGENIAIYTTADNYIENSIIATGTYESEIQKIISFSLRPGDNALDIGCNIGLQSLRMSQIIGKNGKIISFEPLAYLRKKSEKNFKLNQANNILLLPYALSDREDTFKITVDERTYNQGTFSLSQSPSGTSDQTIEVKIADEIEEVQSLTGLSLVKIDVEGFELNVLKGLSKTLQKFRPRIIFEYDTNYWKKNKQDISECYKLLTDLNYALYQISFLGCELISSPNQLRDGNLFCVNEQDE